MLAHVPSFGRNPRGSVDFLAYPLPKACMHVLGTRVPRRFGVARSASSPKAAQALGCSLTPGLRISFGRVICMARAASVPGLWVCSGNVCGVVPLVSAVCGVRGWGSVSVCLWDVCGFVRAPLATRRFRFRRAGWACVLGPGLGCAQPFVAGLSGCVFCAPFFFFFAECPCPGTCCPCPPIPLLSGWAAGSFFFSWCLSACFGVPSPVVPRFPAWCCRFWLGDPPVPFRGSCPWCLLGGGGSAASGGVGGRFGGCGLFSRPPPPPSVVFFSFGGGGCLFLPLPSLAGARTGPHSVLSSGLLLAVAFCLAVFRPDGSGGLCTRWARRPFLPG